jgi:ATP-dependent DNA helicase DinG
VIEVEVHRQLRAFLRDQGEPYWLHHLTMARLVARALRIGRSALIQTGASSGYHGHYRLSYLMPALIWPEPTILVVPEALQQRLLMVEIPRLRQWISTHKPIRTGDRWLGDDFQGLLLTSPQSWLSDRLEQQGRFPTGIPTILDGVDDLETWTRQALTATIQPSDWDDLMLVYPDQAEAIRDVRVQLTRTIFQHPANPYDCYLVEPPEQDLLRSLYQRLQDQESQDQDSRDSAIDQGLPQTGLPPIDLPQTWQLFWQRLQQPEQLIWADIARRQGQFSLHCAPIEVATVLRPVWAQQPVVLIGSALDLEPAAPIYRQQLGLDDLTCLKFLPDRQNELIQLYLPDRLPLPNTPQFQSALLQEIRVLIGVSIDRQGLAVLLVGDTPLKSQIGSVLASEFGSRVQVEKTCLDDNGILVTGWEFWREHQSVLPTPHLMVIATLPLPSLEEPLVSGRVAHYKRLKQDWFRFYLLPEALSELQRAIAPIRETQGVVALLDNRVNYRSYGQQVLSALSPLARINYVDRSLFVPLDASVLD